MKTTRDRLAEIYESDPVGQLAYDLVAEGETEDTVHIALQHMSGLPSTIKVELTNKIRDVLHGYAHTFNHYGCKCKLTTRKKSPR